MRAAVRLDNLMHTFQRCYVLGLERGHIRAVPLAGICSGVFAIHVGGFLKYLGNAGFVFGSIFDGFPHRHDKLRYRLGILRQVIAVHDGDAQNWRGAALGELFPFIDDTRETAQLGFLHLCNRHRSDDRRVDFLLRQELRQPRFIARCDAVFLRFDAVVLIENRAC